MFRARFAYRRVFKVSMKSRSDGEMQAIISVFELPPRESCSNRVSLESRYGTCEPRLSLSPKALITLPSASFKFKLFRFS
jgi:hypothetical protein